MIVIGVCIKRHCNKGKEGKCNGIETNPVQLIEKGTSTINSAELDEKNQSTMKQKETTKL